MRRDFLRTSIGAAAWIAARRAGASFQTAPRSGRAGLPLDPDPRHGWHGASSAAMQLRDGRVPVLPRRLPEPDLRGQGASVPGLAERFPDLPRHFVFEYYPWYDSSAYRHWDQWDRVPPDDLASNYYPRLGPYDSLDHDVLEQHARWILATGAGAVNLSWWGPGSFEDQAVHTVMDVMRDHGVKVAFHLEPYDDQHGLRFADDVLYLLREYGEKRRFDALLVLRDENGTQGPVFKGFRCILPPAYTDCRGITRPIGDYTPDLEWRRQNERLRRTLRGDFDHLTLLADSLDFGRTSVSGFDGIAIYDPFVAPTEYAGYAAAASEAGLVFSFNANAGYDAIEPRGDPGECYEPSAFAPPFPGLDWAAAEARQQAAARASERVAESMEATLAVQSAPALSNYQRGFFLVYVTSFNEWHEGTMFEPMRDGAELTAGQRLFGYHNPAQGDYRLARLGSLVHQALAPATGSALARPA